jgi:hypothetical protein
LNQLFLCYTQDDSIERICERRWQPERKYLADARVPQSISGGRGKWSFRLTGPRAAVYIPRANPTEIRI